MNCTTSQSNVLHLSTRSKDKAEAARWIRKGIELVVKNADTDRPIRQKDGRVQIVERGWTAVVTLKDGIVTKIE